MTYIILDMSNMFYRARHAFKGDIDSKLGMAFLITLSSIKKAWGDFKGSHVVVALEGRSWRKDYYEPYKRNRSDARAAHTPEEALEEKVFWEAFDTFKEFLVEKTNCTILQHPKLEADDLIAGWIRLHLDSKHVIISTDSDYVQLISENVSQYNGVTEVTTKIDGYFDAKNNYVIDNKTNLPKQRPDPKWLLFQKCIRGDTSDNVFSAYPGVRTKGTKKKVGLTEAFEDKDQGGFNWNNLMLQTWTDHNGIEHRVLDDYNRNKMLIDLTQQPAEIKGYINETINNAISLDKQVSQVGIKLLKFCKLYDLKRIAEFPNDYAYPLNARYRKEI
jgi:5'-3' exonuclease